GSVWIKTEPAWEVTTVPSTQQRRSDSVALSATETPPETWLSDNDTLPASTARSEVMSAPKATRDPLPLLCTPCNAPERPPEMSNRDLSRGVSREMERELRKSK